MTEMIEGKEYTLAHIFDDNFNFFIPNYQRPYAWTTSHAQTLLDDLIQAYEENQESGYFLGSLVLIKKKDSPHAEVIDGQQRLTTLQILFSTIASLVDAETRKEISEFLMAPGNSLKGILPSSRLHLRAKDTGFYEKYVPALKTAELIGLKDSELSESQINIRNNAQKFRDQLSGWEVSNLKSLLTFILNKCFLIVVTTPNQEAAFRIFSVLNHRGLDLQGSDILKAEVIGLIPPEEQDTYSEVWEDMEERLGRAAFNQFFDQMVLSIVKAQYAKTGNTIDYILKKVLVKSSDSPQEKNPDPKWFIEEMMKPKFEALITIQNRIYSDPVYGDSVNESLKWLNMIPNKDWIPAAMVRLENEESAKSTASFFHKLERLAAYLTLNPAGHGKSVRIERYGAIGRQIENHEPLTALELSEAEKKEFREMLSGDIYNPRFSKSFRFILQRLDSLKSDTKVDYSHGSFSVEHVLPQTVAPGSYWDKNWTQADREFWVHKLANLIPLSRAMNIKARNYDFETKKAKYFNAKNAAGFVIVGDIAQYPQWTADVVSKRQEELLDILFDHWDLN